MIICEIASKRACFVCGRDARVSLSKILSLSITKNQVTGHCASRRFDVVALSNAANDGRGRHRRAVEP